MKAAQDNVEALSAALSKAREEQKQLHQEATGAEDPEARAKLEALRHMTIHVTTGHKRGVLDHLEEFRMAFPGDDLLFIHIARTTNGLTTFFRGATQRGAHAAAAALTGMRARVGVQVVLRCLETICSPPGL